MTGDTGDTARPLIVLTGHGHPAVRATHAKTIEFTPDRSLGAGGTCVVAVSSVASGGPAAGAVELELVAGSERCTFTAVANPDWDPVGPAVIRRSDVRRSDTLATHASFGASDLPAALKSELTNPNATVTLTVSRAHDSKLRVVLVSGSPSAAERSAADTVVTSEGVTSAADSAVPTHGRVLVLGKTIPHPLLAAANQPIEVYGLEPEQAVALAAADAAMATQLSAVSDVQLRTAALVIRVAATELPRVIKTAQRHGRRTGALLGRLPWVQWGRLDQLVVPAGVRTIWVCLDPAAQVGTDVELLARIAELRATGLTTKALAKEVATEFGVPTNRVYTLALGTATRSRPSVDEP